LECIARIGEKHRLREALVLPFGLTLEIDLEKSIEPVHPIHNLTSESDAGP
jgi:hypothetical protein